VTAFLVTGEQQRELWFEPFRESVKACREVYMVEVKSGQRTLRYFFCRDGKVPVLLGAYSLVRDAWKRVSQEY
jgi:hypothetical protein